MLSVHNGRIVDASHRPVQLRGTCVGGWLNTEDFINGYPGTEGALRATLKDVLGAARAEFFLERLADHFFTEHDVKFIASLGLNTVRIPVHYRHLERDDAPFTYLESGFRRLGQAVEWCARHGLYAVIDLHVVQGWQNSDWHADNASRHSLFWQHPHFQQRFTALWREIAARYSGNPAVAGYDVMNEPLSNAPHGRLHDHYTPDWTTMNRVYRDVVTAIREVDADHVVFLEGDHFGARFDGLDAPFDANLAYSSHHYTGPGFGPGPYPGGTFWGREGTKATLRDDFHASEGARFARRHGVPLWVGEFGSVYNGPEHERPDRLRALDDQLDVLEEFGAHWTTWTYKDVGVMGLVEVPDTSPYRARVEKVTQARRDLHADFWMTWLPPSASTRALDTLAAEIDRAVDHAFPGTPRNHMYLRQAALCNYAGPLLQRAYAECFRDATETEIDDVLASFALANCRVRHDLADVLTRHVDPERVHAGHAD
ncbi:glycoside hydrolase family 5 protein [Deinococcus pimensis]|uniref:glycoside hydrolase family 5 protein n=1 Tax=Deinococcus pimensis TaxID=309888 RepID=UPI0004B33D02|nr:glycoside hydrolase family 5 protein [Deinococcus pimensis]